MGVRVKGQGLLAFERTLGELKGGSALTHVYTSVPPELAHALQHREILPVGWYPVAWLASLHHAAQTAFGEGISREIGRAATRHDVTTIYRFILKFFSPEALIKQSQRILATFCDSGAVVVEDVRKGYARLRYSGCEGATRGVWEDVVGSTEVMLELCGGRCVSGRIVGGDCGESMICVYSWKTD